MKLGSCHIVLLALTACAGIAPQSVTANHDGDAAATIDDVDAWTRLAASDASSVFGATQSVKVIVDQQIDRVYFLQSRRWPLHFDFAARFLSTPGAPIVDGARFNQVQYHDPERRFVLGTIQHFTARNIWTFELYAGDTLAVAPTLAALASIRKHTFFGEWLRYRPVPAAHVAALAEFAQHISVATSGELFGAVQYQALELGTAVGRVRIIDAALADTIGHARQIAALTEHDIAVLTEPPLEIPPVAAIISSQLLAPLGHIAVLAHSRHTPTAAQRDATIMANLRDHHDQWVRLTIAGAAMHIEPLDEASAARALATATTQRRQRLSQPLQLALDHPGLPRLTAIASTDLQHFGAKTVQLARVAALGVPVPRGFGLPFAAYVEFLHSAGLDAQLATMLQDPGFISDAAQRRRRLADFQTAMLAAPVPARIIVPITAQIAVALAGARHVRLRSSTNAEDLAGFSGAGLYRSTRVFAGDQAALARGLREVWASVWSFEAFEERAAFNIDQRRVAMAILVQESIDNDEVSGVAISGNPYYQGRPAVFINAAPRGASVTGGAGGDVPEQILRYTFATMRGIERISRSAQAPTRDLLSDEEVERLGELVQKLHRNFIGADIGTADALDIEFLFTQPNAAGLRRCIIVQARPYAMGWATSRRSD